jgi:hypothetical protein
VPGPTALGEVRHGFALVVLVLGLILIGTAIWYTYFARSLGGAENEPAETWTEGFRSRHVWPILVLTAVFGVAGVAGAGLLLRGGPQADQPAWLGRTLGVFTLAGALAVLAVPIYLVSTRPFTQAVGPPFLWAVAAFGILIVVGMLLLSEGQKDDPARIRLLLMGGGLSLGAATFLLGIGLATYTFREDFTSGLGTWLEKPAVLAWPVAIYLGGLALMFVSIQPALPLVRQDQNIRRITFGANLFVTIFLLLGVLALPNVLAYAEPMNSFFGRSFDWTNTGVHTISEKTRNFMADLREPVKVYVLMPRNHPITLDTQTLLENCRSLNSKFSWELVNPQAVENSTRIRGFMEKYNLSDPVGLLVVVGGEDSSNYSFIKFRDLFDEQAGGPGRRSGLTYTYKGEGLLLNAMLSLLKGQMVIYVTKGHGELELDQPMPKMMGAPRPRGTTSLGTLRDRLTARKGVEVRPLAIDRSTKKVPDDATVVVVARPTTAFTPEEVRVLRDYVQRQRTEPAANKKEKSKGKTKDKKKATAEEDPSQKEEKGGVTAGKLFLLLDPVVVREGDSRRMAPTGLEGLLAEYGVKLGMDRIESMQGRNPLDVGTVPDPRSNSPIAKAFSPDPRQLTLFNFSDVRSVESAGGPPGRHTVDSILIALPQFGIWKQTNFDVDPVEFREGLRREEKRLLDKIEKNPVAIAVGVSDSSGAPPGMPRDAIHGGGGQDTPRMVVFGTSSWITDTGLSGRQGTLRTDLFNSCVSWLREEKALGTGDVPDKTRKEYELNVQPANFWRLVLLPMALMLMTVVALGTGVWVVRRR